tara:strand:- start:358 stop:987 length:630 start_codon:yes stop_codon:yes gene_type:complete
MSDEITPTPTPTPTPVVSPPDTSMRDSLRAVSAERSRLAGELKTANEQLTRVQADLKSTTTRHNQDMHLVGAGITSKRGRRAIRREYTDALSEVADGGESPAFGAFVEELKDDPLYGRWFSTATDKPVDKSFGAVDNVPKVKRTPASNPNAGTTTPRPPGAVVDTASYTASRNQLGGRGAMSANMEQLVRQGNIHPDTLARLKSKGIVS